MTLTEDEDFGPIGPYQEPLVTAEEAQAARLATATRQRYESLIAGTDESDAFVGHVRPAWRDFARCRGQDPEIFYPGRGESTKGPRSFCDECPVTEPCLEYALNIGEKVGIWGGTSERERRRIRRERATVTEPTPDPDRPWNEEDLPDDLNPVLIGAHTLAAVQQLDDPDARTWCLEQIDAGEVIVDPRDPVWVVVSVGPPGYVRELARIHRTRVLTDQAPTP